MNDIRRTILWVIFGFALVMLWDKWQVHNGHKATFFPVPSATAPAASAPGGAASATSAGVPAPVAAAPAAVAGEVPGQAAAAPAARSERFEVSTDLLKLTFDTAGGSLVKAALLKNADTTDHSRPFVLLDDSTERVYMAQTGLIGTASLPNHTTLMTAVPGARALADGSDRLEVKFESPAVDGVKLVKTYTLQRGSYALGVKHEVVNGGAAAIAPQLYMQLVRDGNKPPGESSF